MKKKANLTKHSHGTSPTRSRGIVGRPGTQSTTPRSTGHRPVRGAQRLGRPATDRHRRAAQCETARTEASDGDSDLLFSFERCRLTFRVLLAISQRRFFFSFALLTWRTPKWPALGTPDFFPGRKTSYGRAPACVVRGTSARVSRLRTRAVRAARLTTYWAPFFFHPVARSNSEKLFVKNVKSRRSGRCADTPGGPVFILWSKHGTNRRDARSDVTRSATPHVRPGLKWQTAIRARPAARFRPTDRLFRPKEKGRLRSAALLVSRIFDGLSRSWKSFFFYLPRVVLRSWQTETLWGDERKRFRRNASTTNRTTVVRFYYFFLFIAKIINKKKTKNNRKLNLYRCHTTYSRAERREYSDVKNKLMRRGIQRDGTGIRRVDYSFDTFF